MPDPFRFGPFVMDAAEHSLRFEGRPVALTGRPFDTLLYLVRNPGRLVTRDELITAVWGETIVEEGNLHWTISVVRRTLTQESPGTWIETVRGLGYRFLVPVEIVQPAPEPDPPEPDLLEPDLLEPKTEPSPISRSRRWLGLVCAVLLFLTVAGTVISRRRIAPVEETPSVAVVGFRNLSPRQAEGWLGTALAEMLAADLDLGGPLRLISGDEVASMRRDLGLRLDGPLGRTELAQIRSHLGSEWVIVGSYLLLEGQDPPLRVDALLRHTGTGSTQARVTRRGRQEDLFQLSGALAGDLRRALGQPADPGSGAVALGAMPVSPEAQRLYAEGLERFQLRDLPAAIARLEEAVAADPQFPGAWLALARARVLQGSPLLAQDAALKAVEQSSGLPERQRLAAEVTYLSSVRRWPEAIRRMHRVYELSGRAFEEALELSDLQMKAGQEQEALATIAAVGREHPALRDDARLLLQEAEIYGWMDDYPNVVTASQRALDAARRQGMVQVEIRALHHQAFARRFAEGLAACDQALAAIRLARRKAEASGDPLLLNGVLVNLGAVLSNCNQPALAERVQQEALGRLRKTGALGKMGPLLFNLGAARRNRGDLIGADRLMRDALATCETHSGILCRERFLHPVGVNRLHRAELAEARRMLEEGIRLNLRIGNRSRVAEAQGYLPTLTAWSGDLAQGIKLQRELLAGFQAAGSTRGAAWGHQGLAILLAEAGRGTEALGHARRSVVLANQFQEASLDACSRASLALAELATGDLATADRESARALARLRLPQKPFCSFIVWSVRSHVLLETGQLDAASALIDEGLDQARRGGFVTYELIGRLFRAQLAQKRGRPAEARRLAADLAAEAKAKGLGVVAQGCELLIGR